MNADRILLYSNSIAIVILAITIVVLQPGQGPPGFMGPPGPVGEQGPKGDKGDKGDPGDSILTLHIKKLPDEIVPLPKPRPKHLAHRKSEWAR